MKAAELEGKFAEYDGYTAEARAGELLLGVGITIDLHQGPMSAVSPGWKLRVLLAQALFSNPDILLLDEPTNNLDINTIRWLEDVLNERNSTMIIISHDRHFLNQVCTHMADMDYGTLKIYPVTTTTTCWLRPRRATSSWPTTPRRKRKSPSCRTSCAASRPTSPRPARRLRAPR
jgi:ATPase subunit of ABC transporter with duplicated ATPase domains